MDIFFSIIIITLGIILGYAVFRHMFSAGRQIVKTKPKLPGRRYTLFYSDEKQVDRQEDVIYSKILHSDRYNIQGKPDFIYKKGRGFLPVELKSGSIGEEAFPREGDLMQLAAYFLIIEDLFGVSPEWGNIIYSDYMFKVKNTKQLKRRTIQTLREMRDMLVTGENEPAASFVMCKHCVCRGTVCEFCEE